MSALAPCFDRICVNNNHSSKNNNNDNVNKNNDEAINDSATNDGATSDGVNSDGLIDHAKWNRRKQKKPQRKNALSDAEDDRFEQQTRQRSDVTMTLAESRTLNNCYRGDVTRGTPGGQCEYNDDVTVTIRRSSQSGHFEISVHEEEEEEGESMDTSCLPDRETDRTNDKPSAGGPTDDRSGEAPNGRLGAQANDRSGNAPDERRGNAPDKTPETNCNRANLCAGLDRQGSSGIRDFNRPISGCPISTTSTFRTHFGGLIDSATGAPPLRTETEESARHNSTPDGGRCNQFGHSCETNKGSGQDGKENDAQSGYPLNGFEGRVRLVGQTGDDLMLGRVKQEANYSNGKLAKGDAMYVTTSDFPDVSIHRDETQAMTSTLSLSPSTDQNDVSFDCEDNADFDRQHHAAVYQAVSAGSATAAHHQSGVNVQACGVCSKTFANVYRLQRHLISHEESSELRKFKCPECSKAFKFKHHLKEHVRIHSGEKPFECPNCCKRFSHSGSYSSHMTSKKCWQIGNSGGGSGCGNGSGNGLGKIPIMRTTGDKQESTASLSVAASITNRILQQQPGYGEHPSPLTPPFYYNQTNFFNSSVIGQLDAIQRQSLLAEYIARWNGLYVPSLGLAPTGDASGRVPAALPLMYDQNISRYVQQCRSELGKNLLADWRGISEGSRTGCDLASLIKLKKPDENENAHRKSNTEPEVSEVPIKKEEQDCHSENAIIADAPKVVPIDTADPVTQKSERVASPECANNPTDTCKIENGIIVGSQRFEQTEKKESGHGDERKFEDGGRLLTPKGLLETEEDVQQGNNSMEKGTVDVETQGIVENKTDALDGMTAGEGHLVEQPGKLESGDGTAADIRVKDEKSDVSVPSIGTDERKSSPGVSIMCRYCSALFTSPVQLHQHERYLCKTVSIVSTALAKLTPSGELLPHRTSASVAFTPSSELLPNRGGTNNNTLAPSSERWTQGDQTRCSRTDDDERTTTSEEDGETGLNRCYRVRSMISGGQQQTLKAYYHRNARPSGPDLERLAAQVAFPKRVVQVWFQNMRARDRRRHKTFSEIRQPSVMAAYVDESSDISPRKPEPISAASSSINPQSNTIQQRLADHSGIVADQPHRVAKPEMPYRRTSGADYQGPSEDLSVQDVPLDLSAKPLDPPPTAHLARKSFSEDAFEESSVKALDLSFKENRCINTGTTSPDRKSFELPVSTATMTSSISNNLRNGFHSSLQSDSISPELAFLCRIPAINSSQEHSNDMRFVANNFNTATRKMALDYRLALKEGRRQRKRRHLLKSEADDHAKIPRSYLTYNGACADGTTGNAMSESGNGSSGETVFACDQCDKSFGKQSSLARHKYEHSGQRPFTCDLCSKAFKHKHHLTEHKRLHSGEKPYKCSKCGKTFSHSGSYSQHMNHRYKYCRPLIDGVDIDTDRSLEGTTQPETEVV